MLIWAVEAAGSGSGGRSGGGGGIEGTGIQSIDEAGEAWAKSRGDPYNTRYQKEHAQDAASMTADGRVEIRGDQIVVKTPRKNDISDHVKSLGYKFSGGEWSKQVTSFSQAHAELKKLGSKKGLVENNKGDIKEVMQSKD